MLLLIVVVATGALVFAHAELSRHPLPFLCIPPLIWAAFRFGLREVATSVLLLSAIATWATVRGFGPFATGNDNESLLLLQAFMVTIAVLTMSVAGLVWERKAIERERLALLERERAARADAEWASHAKDEFLAMLSHELRNPLAAIGTAAQVLLAPGAPQGYAERAVDIINRQTRHLSRLVDDLLDIARVSSGKILLARREAEPRRHRRGLLDAAAQQRAAESAPSRCRHQAGLGPRRSGAVDADRRQSSDERDQVHAARRADWRSNLERSRRSRAAHSRQRCRHCARIVATRFRTVYAGTAHARSRPGRTRRGTDARATIGAGTWWADRCHQPRTVTRQHLHGPPAASRCNRRWPRQSKMSIPVVLRPGAGY